MHWHSNGNAECTSINPQRSATIQIGTMLIALTLTTLGLSCNRDQRAPGTPHSDKPATSEQPAENPPAGSSNLRTVYVPAYSHVPSGPEMEQQSLLSILLSVRNVDSTATITLTHVDYFNTSGHRVRRFLKTPRILRPLETAEFTVASRDTTGGSGANFLVYWEGPPNAHPLLTEAVMFGHLGAGYLSFTSRGVELERRPASNSLTPDAYTSEPQKKSNEAAAQIP